MKTVAVIKNWSPTKWYIYMKLLFMCNEENVNTLSLLVYKNYKDV